MSYRGHIENGVVVFDEAIHLPDGALVTVEVVSASTGPEPCAPEQCESLYEALRPLIGSVTDLPPDASINLDHYLYGHPKKS